MHGSDSSSEVVNSAELLVVNMAVAVDVVDFTDGVVVLVVVAVEVIMETDVVVVVEVVNGEDTADVEEGPSPLHPLPPSPQSLSSDDVDVFVVDPVVVVGEFVCVVCVVAIVVGGMAPLGRV